MNVIISSQRMDLGLSAQASERIGENNFIYVRFKSVPVIG